MAATKEAGRRGRRVLRRSALLGTTLLLTAASLSLASTAPDTDVAQAATAQATGTASASATPSATASASATPAATTTTAAKATSAAATGQSSVEAATDQSAKVGAIFSSDSIAPGNHHCTASVVDSPAGDVIVTAAHCLAAGGGDGSVFVPGYRDGTAPDGVWTITKVVESSGWTGDGDADDDVAFALVAPANGRSLESAVGGGYTLSTAGTTSGTVQLTGYPAATDEPITCTGAASAYSGTQLTVYCTAFTGGTSGTAWLADYDAAADEGSVIGVIGGYEQGGDTADVSYSVVFDDGTAALYQQALAAG